MTRPLVAIASIATILSTMLGGCWTDPDSPDTWLAQINSSSFKRRESLVNLYRIHETTKALAERPGAAGEESAKSLEAFRKKVNPVLVKAFDVKINDRYEATQEILEHLMMFEAEEAVPLYIRIIQEYVDDTMDKYGDVDLQEGLVAKALGGLGALAEDKKVPGEAMNVIGALIDRICRTGKGSGVLEALDQRSFIRNAVVNAMPPLIEALPEKKTVAGRLLATILDFGFQQGQIQDPMVNIFAARSLGNVGDNSPRTVQALIASLFRKGRGRAFHPYSVVALAQLPAAADGSHPAVKPLVWLVKGDPWTRVLAKLEEDDKAKEANQSTIDALNERLSALKEMPPCPDDVPSDVSFICDIFWESRVERWEEQEPGVVELNSIIALREIGDPGKDNMVLTEMLAHYGSRALERKWFRKMDREDRWLPRVQNQRMQIEGYGRDMNIRMEFLFAVGHLGHIDEVEGLKAELIRSLNWSGDPGSMMKAAEAIGRAPHDEELLRTLIDRIGTVQSWIGHSFKYRMFQHAGWAAAQKQCPAAKPELDQRWQECQAEGNSAEECFKRFRENFWLPEVKKLVGYFEPNDVKDYQHEYCADPETKSKEPACKESPTEEERRLGVPKCYEWGVCNAETFYTCLDGDQEMRLNFASEAMRAATMKELPLLQNLKPEIFLTPPNRTEESMPKEGTTYYDPMDLEILKNPHLIMTENMVKARRKKAIETIERRLCQMTKRLTVLETCKHDINCYIATLKGDNLSSFTDQDCAQEGFPTVELKEMDWRRQEKAAHMLGILGRESANRDMAIRTLSGAYEGAPVSVRQAILRSLDRIADSRHIDNEEMGQAIQKVIDDETSRRVRGVWQINRDAQACLGRMSRRKPSG